MYLEASASLSSSLCSPPPLASPRRLISPGNVPAVGQCNTRDHHLITRVVTPSSHSVSNYLLLVTVGPPAALPSYYLLLYHYFIDSIISRSCLKQISSHNFSRFLSFTILLAFECHSQFRYSLPLFICCSFFIFIR